MMSGHLFSLLSYIGCAIRKEFQKPFGGVRVVVCGDFHQLPPVERKGAVVFAFESLEWQQLFPRENCMILKSVVRQQQDPQFVEILKKIRIGDASCVDELNRRCLRKLSSDDGVVASRLFCRNVAVDAMNKVRAR
jgi:ATP-dependent DNA helicase PIF1